MGTKSFFNKQKSQEEKIRGQNKSTIKDVQQDIESIDYVKQYSIDKLDFIPQLDFQDPANFVKYGSAKDYYVDLVDSVVQSYPYDGSLAERLRYRNGLAAIQKHEFDKNYPRATGYADFDDESFLSTFGDAFSIGTKTFKLGESSTKHYIITDNYSDNLIYNTGSNQVGSIELDFTKGVTLEFWMKKSLIPDQGETQNEVVFSISNTQNDLFQVTTDVTASSVLLTTFSRNLSSAEFVYEFDTGLSSIVDEKWHHYAFAFSTSSTGFTGEFYFDGKFKQKKGYANASPTYYLSGTLDATVAASSLTDYLGDGKLLGELDEIRLWKTTRDAKQIGVNYFYDVGGGGNTDKAKVNNDSPLGLSLYYKFNEGNTGNTATDSVVLDYSGRLTNGVWVGYNSDGHVSRPDGSAITDSGIATETGAPIIYSTHPTVQAYKAEKIISGSAYDTTNLGSMYNMLPHHISSDDAANGLLIRKMMQIMSSYLDTLHAQITAISELQDGSYVSGSNAKPNPFSKRNLISYGFDIPDVFIDPGVIEEIYFKDEKRLYEDKLFNLKNLIFQNIFNNLNYINKSKGTEKSFRNFFRSLGIGQDVVKLRMYADDSTFVLRNNYEQKSFERKYLNFNYEGHFDATLYQTSSTDQSLDWTGIPDGNIYIPGDANYPGSFTLETEIILPRKNKSNDPGYVPFPSLISSVAGFHSSGSATPEEGYTHSRATAIITTCAEADIQDTKDFTLTNAAGVTITFNFSGGKNITTNHAAYDATSPVTVDIGYVGLASADPSATGDEIVTRINAGTGIDMVASKIGNNVLVTQGTPGAAGNTVITQPAGATGLTTPARFTGGDTDLSIYVVKEKLDTVLNPDDSHQILFRVSGSFGEIDSPKYSYQYENNKRRG